MTASPVLRYPGAKWRLAPWIISHFPRHATYVEPFFGSGAVFFSKRAVRNEYVNDLNGDLVNFFRMLRERPTELAALVELTPWAREEYELAFEPAADPLERARRLAVRQWQSVGGRDNGRYAAGWKHNGSKGHGTGSNGVTDVWRALPARLLAVADRLKDVQIECRPALEVILKLSAPDVLLYVDPPYLGSTRDWQVHYRAEMLGTEDHLPLLEALDEHPGLVVLSGYPSELYDERLAHWTRVSRQAQTEAGQTRTEVLWINPRAGALLAQRDLFSGGAS